MDDEFRNLRHHIDQLPWLARLYRNAFQSGNAHSTSASRFPNRVLYYLVSSLTRRSQAGQMSLQVGDARRTITFDARNRQFNVLYFDKFQTCYEPDVTALISHFLPADGVFFDIGSNWGYFPLLVASAKSFRGRIHAFEPMPNTYRDLTSVIEQAGLTQSVTCHEMALGATESAVSMSCPRHSGLARVRADGGGETVVRQRRLDDLSLDSPDFIKLDAEGAEASILLGASRVLSDSRPMIVFESACHSESDSALATLELLENQGYQLFIPVIETRGADSDAAKWKFAGRCPAANLRHGTLKLLPMSSRSRFLFDPYLNLFACARERLGLVAHRIEDSWCKSGVVELANGLREQRRAA